MKNELSHAELLKIGLDFGTVYEPDVNAVILEAKLQLLYRAFDISMPPCHCYAGKVTNRHAEYCPARQSHLMPEKVSS
jgi:hypothetical protein